MRLHSPAGITGHPILSEFLLSAVEAEASWRLPARVRAGVEAAPNLHLTGDIRESIVRSINSCGFYMGLVHEHTVLKSSDQVIDDFDLARFQVYDVPLHMIRAVV